MAWIFVPEIWFALAIVLVIAETVFGLNFFVLPVGISALVLAGLLWLQSRWGTEVFSNWEQILVFFSVLSVVGIGIVRRLFQRSGPTDTDINEY